MYVAVIVVTDVRARLGAHIFVVHNNIAETKIINLLLLLFLNNDGKHSRLHTPASKKINIYIDR